MSTGTTSRVRDQQLLRGVLKTLALRWDLTPAQLTAVERRSWVLAAARGTLIAERGARFSGIFTLGLGSVKLMLRGSESARTVRIVAAGQSFGEALALLGKPSPFDAVALTASKLVVIPSAVVIGLMENDARFARRIAFMIAERYYELLAELQSATTQRSVQRLAAYLRSLASEAAESSYAVTLPVSKTLLAERLGMKKETLSRLLRQLAEQKLIEVSSRNVHVLDGLRLAELARAH